MLPPFCRSLRLRSIAVACIVFNVFCQAACPADLAGAGGSSAVFDDGGAILDPLTDAQSAGSGRPFVNVWGFPTGAPTPGYMSITLTKGHDDPTIAATTASARPRGRAWGNGYAADLPESLRGIRGVASISGGTSNTCVLDIAGRASCFARTPSAADLLPNDDADPFMAISAQGEGIACGLGVSGKLRCAVDASRQRAFLDTYFNPEPNATYAGLATGLGFLCALRSAAPPTALAASGVPIFDGATGSLAALSPSRPLALGGTSAGPAVGVDCWLNAALSPNAGTTNVPASAAPAHDLVTGYGYACTITAPAAQVVCWGRSADGVDPFYAAGLAGKRVILLAPGYQNMLAQVVDEAATGLIPTAVSWGTNVGTGAPPSQAALLPPLVAADGGNFATIGLRMKSRSLAMLTTTKPLQPEGAFRAPSSEYVLPYGAVSATGDAGARVANLGVSLHVTEGLSLRAGLVDAFAAAAGAARERALTLPLAYAVDFRISTFSSGVTLGARIGAVKVVQASDVSGHVGWATFRLAGPDGVGTPLSDADALLTVQATNLDRNGIHELTCGNNTCCVRASYRNAGWWTPPQAGTVACAGASPVATTASVYRSVAISGDCVLAVRGSGASTGSTVEVLTPASNTAACSAADRALLLPPLRLANVTFLHIAAERTGFPRVVCGLAATGLPDSATGAGGVCWGQLSEPGWGELARTPALVASSDPDRLLVISVSAGRACAAVMDVLRDTSHDIFCWGRRPGAELTYSSPTRLYQDWNEGRAVFALHPHGYCAMHRQISFRSDYLTLCFGAAAGGRRVIRSDTLVQDAVQLSVAGDHVCALAGSGAGGCAGLDSDAQSSVSQLFTNVSADAAAVASCSNGGFDNRTISLMTAPGITCALSASGSVSCSGDAAATAGPGASTAVTGPESLPAQAPVCDATLLSPAELLVVNRTGADVALSLTTGQPSGRSSAWLSDALGGPASRIVAYQAGERLDAACAVDAAGAAVCLTRNRVSNSTTLHLPPADSRFVEVCATLGFFVGIHAANRSIVVWGATELARDVSQLHVPHWRGPFYGITCGHSYACAVDASRSVVCFPPRQKDIAAYPNILPAVVPSNTTLALGSPAGAVCLLAPIAQPSGGSDSNAPVNISCFGDDAAAPLYSRHWRMHIADDSGAGYRLVSLGPWRAIAVPATASGRASLMAWGDDFPLLQADVPQPTNAANWSAVAIGWRHACAIDGDTGSTICWGDPAENRTDPAAAAPPAVAIVAGAAATCVIAAADRSLVCWGSKAGTPAAARNGSDGSLLQGFSPAAAHVCAGRHFACGWLPAVGSVACFDVDSAAAPLHILDGGVMDQSIVTPSGGLAKLSCGAAHVCVLGGSGGLRCAGVGPDKPFTDALALPTGAGGTPLAWADVSASYSSTCGIVASSRRLICWGVSATGNADGNPWPQGTVRVRARQGSLAGASGARAVSIGVGGVAYSAEACAVNLTCSDIYQAARYVAEPFATFLLPPSTALTAPLLFHRGCYHCTLAPAAASGAVLVVPRSLPLPLDAPAGYPAAAVIIQSTFTLANVTFVVASSSGGSAGAGAITPAAVVHASVQSTDDVTMTGLSFIGVPARMAAIAFAPSGVAGTAAGSLRFQSSVFSAGQGQVMTAVSAAAVAVTDLRVVLATNATLPAPLLQLDAIASVSLASVSLKGGAAVAALVEAFAVDSLSISNLTVSSASVAAVVRASECGSIALAASSITDSVLGSLLLAPARLAAGSRDLVSSITFRKIYMARVTGRNVTAVDGSFSAAGILDDRGSLWSAQWPASVNESIPQSSGLLLTRTLLPSSSAPAAGSGISWPVNSISVSDVTVESLAVLCTPASLANASAAVFTGLGNGLSPKPRPGPTALVAVSVPFTVISVSSLTALGDAAGSGTAGAPSALVTVAAETAGSGITKAASSSGATGICTMPVADIVRVHSPYLPPQLFIRGYVGSLALSSLSTAASAVTRGGVAAAIATVTGHQALDVTLNNVSWSTAPSPLHADLRAQDAVGSGIALPSIGFRHQPAYASLLLQDGGLRLLSVQGTVVSVNCSAALGPGAPTATAHRCFAIAVREHSWLSTSTRRSLTVSIGNSSIDGNGKSSGILIASGLLAPLHDLAVTVAATSFTRCFAPLDGAALLVAAARANVSLALQNSSVSTSEAFRGGGGALMVQSGPWEASNIVGTSYAGQYPSRIGPTGSWSPQGFGPTIPATAANLEVATFASISACSFFAALSGGQGGGAIAMLVSNPLSLRVSDGTRFERCTAASRVSGETYGGAIFIQQRAPPREFVRAAISIVDSAFVRNAAVCLGGAIAVMHDSGLQLDVADTSFDGNLAVQTGNFQPCLSNSGGGAFWHGQYRESSYFSADVRLLRVNASDNIADSASPGGFAFLQLAELEISGGFFLRNMAGKSGGAIHAASCHVTVAGGALFSGNFANTSGGALMLQGGFRTHFFNGTTFTLNRALGVGGAVAVSSASLTVMLTTVDRCSSGTAGGGLFFSGSDSTVDITYSTFTRCSACVELTSLRAAAALATASGSAAASSSSSSAAANGMCVGGAVYAADAMYVFCYDSTISDSWAAAGGGAMALSAVPHGETTDCIFSESAAGRAAFRRARAAGVTPLPESAIIPAQVPESIVGLGGCILASSSSYIGLFSMFGTQLLNCSADLGGGLAVVTSSSSDLGFGASIRGCNATIAGGAAFLDMSGAPLAAAGANASELAAAVGARLLVDDAAILEENSVAAGGYGPNIATTAIGMVMLMPSGNGTSAPLGTTFTSAVAVVEPGTAVTEPLFQLQLLDGLGAVAVADSATCILSALDSSVSPPASQQLSRTVFLSVNGVVSVSDVAILAAPGSAMNLSLSCISTGSKGLAGSFDAAVFTRPARAATVLVMPALAGSVVGPMFAQILFNTPLPPLLLYIVREDGAGGQTRIRNLRPADTACDFYAGLTVAGAAAAAAQTAAAGGSAAADTSWRVITKKQAAPFNENGTLTFSDVTLQPLAEHAGLSAALRVSCSFRGVQLPDVTLATTFDTLELRWRVAPPNSTLPSTSTPIAGRGLSLRLWRLAQRRNLVGDTASTRCDVSIDSPTSSYSNASSSAASGLAKPALYGLVSVEANAANGIVNFANLALDAPFGSIVPLLIQCKRSAGDPDDPIMRLNVSIPAVDISWVEAPPPEVLGLTHFAVSAALQDKAGIVLASLAALANSSTSSSAGSGISCTLSASGAATLVAAAATDYIRSPDERGVISFPRIVLKPSSATASPASRSSPRVAILQLSCQLGQQWAPPLTAQVVLPSLGLIYLRPPPLSWLPATPSLRSPVLPSPLLTLIDSTGRPVRVDRGVTCEASLKRVDGADVYADDTQLLSVPAGGFSFAAALEALSSAEEASAAGGSKQLVFSRTAAVWNTSLSPWMTSLPATLSVLTTSPSINGSEATDAASRFGYSLPRLSSSASAATPLSVMPIALRPLTPQVAALAATLQLCVRCALSADDPSDELCVQRRVTSMAAILLQPGLPQALQPGAVFNLSIALVDRDALGALGEAAVAASGAAGVPLSAVSHAILQQDGDTTCSLTLPAGGDSSFARVVAGTPQAAAGLLFFDAVTVLVAPGRTVSIALACSRGGLAVPVLPRPLQPVAIATCKAGYFVSPALSCEVCGENTHRDHGASYEWARNTTTCERCPPRLSVCSEGRLTLLNGFYVAPISVRPVAPNTSAALIDDKLEVHDCPRKEACTVNEAARTFGCAAGYSGPFCAVCDTGYANAGSACEPCTNQSLGVFLAILLPVGILALGLWAASRRITDADPSAPLTRIVLSYLQFMGTLLGSFVAQGSARVRDTFGFAQSVGGGGPLSLHPLACVTHWDFYERFGLTASLPLLMMASTLLGHRILRAYVARKGSSKSSSPGELSAAATVAATAPALPPTTPTSALVRNPLASSDAGAAASGDTIDKAGAVASAARGHRASLSAAVKTLVQGGSPSQRNAVSTSCRGCAAALVNPMTIGPLVFVLTLTMSAVLDSSFAILDCWPDAVTVAPGVRATYLSRDMSLQCGGALHAAMSAVAVAVILLLGAGAPIAFACLLVRRRRDLHTPSIFSALGFLYQGYMLDRPHRFAYETAVIFRKVAVVAVAALVKDALTQLLAASLLLSSSLAVLFWARPYALVLWTVVDGISLYVLLVTALATVSLLKAQTAAAQCLGLSDSQIPSGLGAQNCGELRAALVETDASTTSSLMLLNGGLVIAFAVLAVRLRCIASVRRRRLAQLAAGSSAGGGDDLAAVRPGIVARAIAAATDVLEGSLCAKQGAPASNSASTCCGRKRRTAPVSSAGGAQSRSKRQAAEAALEAKATAKAAVAAAAAAAAASLGPDGSLQVDGASDSWGTAKPNNRAPGSSRFPVLRSASSTGLLQRSLREDARNRRLLTASARLPAFADPFLLTAEAALTIDKRAAARGRNCVYRACCRGCDGLRWLDMPLHRACEASELLSAVLRGRAGADDMRSAIADRASLRKASRDVLAGNPSSVAVVAGGVVARFAPATAAGAVGRARRASGTTAPSTPVIAVPPNTHAAALSSVDGTTFSVSSAGAAGGAVELAGRSAGRLERTAMPALPTSGRGDGTSAAALRVHAVLPAESKDVLASAVAADAALPSPFAGQPSGAVRRMARQSRRASQAASAAAAAAAALAADDEGEGGSSTVSNAAGSSGGNSDSLHSPAPPTTPSSGAVAGERRDRLHSGAGTAASFAAPPAPAAPRPPPAAAPALQRGLSIPQLVRRTSSLTVAAPASGPSLRLSSTSSSSFANPLLQLAVATSERDVPLPTAEAPAASALAATASPTESASSAPPPQAAAPGPMSSRKLPPTEPPR